MQRSAQRLTGDDGAAWWLLLALAITVTSCAEKVDPNTGAGVERFIAGDLSGALEALRAAERAGSDHSATYSYLARTLLALGKYSEGHEAIEKAIALEPKRAELHEIHGSIHLARYTARAWTDLQEKDAADAAGAYEEAIDLDPGRSFPHYNLGIVHSYLDSTRLAEQAFRAALAVDSTLAQAHKRLGRILRRRGRAGEAAAAFEKAVAFAPGDAEARYRLGLTYRDLGLFEKAAEAVENALELNPRAPKIRFTLGQLYMRLGRRGEGRSELNRSEQLRQQLQGLHTELTPPAGPTMSLGTLKSHYHMGLKNMLAEISTRPCWSSGAPSKSIRITHAPIPDSVWF